MKNKLKVGFWERIARIILTNIILILGIILAITIFLAFQWKNLGMTYTEANLLPKKLPIKNPIASIPTILKSTLPLL